MEELLNKLIKKGWKPFNVDCEWTDVEVLNRLNDNRYIPEHSKIIFKTETHWHVFDCNIRDLVSKSSWLWQFVCENGMVKENNDVRIKKYRWDNECDTNCCYDDYEYRLIESSLKDESELEDFLLSNIKVDVESN